MTDLDVCREQLTEIRVAVAATLPSDRTRALLTLLRAAEIPAFAGEPSQPAQPGWNLALRLCLERQDGGNDAMPASNAPHAAWAARFLADCNQLALAHLALAQCASGHLHLQQRAPHAFVAWPTSRRLGAEERERADFDWWSAYVARQVAPRLAAILAERPRILALRAQKGVADREAGYGASDPTIDRYYRQLGQAYVARFACQHSYPADAAIGGTTFGQYADILALLTGWLHHEQDRCAPDGIPLPIPRNERALVAALAGALDADWAAIGNALQALILDRDNAAYHSAFPGRAVPPLIRLDEDRVVWSARGLLGEPLIFLARELRRRHAQEYHNSAHLREGVFRQDLYRLFNDKRYVMSAGRVELKRSGEARTDLDALIFDRKTGTLGVFELKAQDPFARSAEERQRQRDNFFHANRQVSAILEWVQRRGADDLLVRFDERAAKRFRVQKVHVFVLGRYLAHFSGGPEPDRRAAWGSWPQVLQIVESGALDPESRNPIGTLFARLRDAAALTAPTDAESEVIAVGDFRLHIFPSFAEMRSTGGPPA
jgi:hypothetical protein